MKNELYKTKLNQRFFRKCQRTMVVGLIVAAPMAAFTQVPGGAGSASATSVGSTGTNESMNAPQFPAAPLPGVAQQIGNGTLTNIPGTPGFIDMGVTENSQNGTANGAAFYENNNEPTSYFNR